MIGIDLDFVFQYHPPRPDQIPRYERLREAAKVLARELDALVPDGPDKSAAVRKLRECVMTANAAIAMDGSLVRSDPAIGQALAKPRSADVLINGRPVEIRSDAGLPLDASYEEILVLAVKGDEDFARAFEAGVRFAIGFHTDDGKMVGMLAPKQAVSLEGGHGIWKFSVVRAG